MSQDIPMVLSVATFAPRWRARRGFTMVELLVVIAIIGLLISLLLPAVQSARESSRRTHCQNNLHQLALAAQSFADVKGRLPPGSDAKPNPANPDHPHTFFRWSVLAHLTPYIEQAAAHDLLNMKVPLYVDSKVSVENVNAVNQVLPMFLCPSDIGRPVAYGFAPTNYAACGGSGKDGGTPFDTDGAFFVNSEVRFGQIPDGLSNTVAFSESTLGTGRESFSMASEANRQTDYAFVFLAPLTEAACKNPFFWNVTNRRGFAWVNGEYRCATYNHYLPPNSPQHDCISNRTNTNDLTLKYSVYGWRAARSKHPGGVNVAMIDGSTRFIQEGIEPLIWRGISTRKGDEPLPEF